MKIDLFQSYGHCWVFQTCWHIACNTLIASSFRIFKQLSWNSVTSTSFLRSNTSLSPFTSHCRMSGSWWVTFSVTRVTKIFFVQFCVFLPSLLDLFCFYYIFIISVLYLACLCMRCFFDSSNFLEEIASRSPSAVFLYSLALFIEEGLPVSPCYSLEFCIQFGAPFPFSLAFGFYSFLFVRPLQTTTLTSYLSFSFRWFWPVPPVQCYEPLSLVLQALFTRSNP